MNTLTTSDTGEPPSLVCSRCGVNTWVIQFGENRQALCRSCANAESLLTVHVTGATPIQKYNPPVTDDGLDLDDVCAGHLTALRELAELRDTVRLSAIESAVNAACTCGGGGPGACCPACAVWHIVSGRVTP